jgi:hypothetical protein
MSNHEMLLKIIDSTSFVEMREINGYYSVRYQKIDSTETKTIKDISLEYILMDILEDL